MLFVFFAKTSMWVLAMLATVSQVGPANRRRRRHCPRPPAPLCPGALRVLFLHRDLPHHGGVARCLLYLARGTDPQNIEFHVASFDEPSRQMQEAFATLNIEPRCIGDRGYRLPAQRLGWLIEERGIDIIVATTFKAYLCAKWAARRRGVGVVFWIHAIRGTLQGRFRRGLIRFLSQDDAMLFVSWAARTAHLPAGHRAAAQVVHNGVEDIADDPQHQPYGPEMRQSLGLPPRGLVLAYIGEFVAWKDHRTAINAVHELVRRNLDVQLLLIGVGREMESVRRLAASGPGDPRIHFLGARSDVRRILGLVDIYIHPCREEGFGLAVVEAMLAKCAVVAAREGALVELVESGKTGLLVNPGDAREFADAIVQLAADPATRQRMALAARQSCLEKFGIDKFADGISSFLEDCFPSAVRRRRGEMHPPQPSASLQTAGAH